MKKPKLASSAGGQENVPAEVPEKKPKVASSAEGRKKAPAKTPDSPVASTSFAHPETIWSESLESKSNENKEETQPTAPLSPEQKQRMEASKLQAEMKLVAKKTHGVVINVGPTWYKALKAEFEKPYFLQVSLFSSAQCLILCERFTFFSQRFIKSRQI